jgi:hypothetical protein
MRSLKTARSLTAGEKELLLRCRQAVAELDPSAQIILYGSRARAKRIQTPITIS